MSRLRWLTIVVPVVLIGSIELLSDTILDPYLPFPWDTVLIMIVTGLLALALSGLAFRRIDELGADLRARNLALEARETSLRALQDMSVAISTRTDLDDILGTVAETARRMLGADLALVVSSDGEGHRVRARSGPAELFVDWGHDGDGRRPPSGPVEASAFVRRERVATLVEVPIRRGTTTTGRLVAGSVTRRSFGDDERETLQALADQAAVAVENDRLRRELRAAAVQGERERIARELHDGLAQVLGYVNTKSLAATELLAAGRPGEAAVQIDELGAASRSLYVDVREAILGLGSPVEPAGGFVAALRDYADRFAEASKLAVLVEADPGADADLGREVEDDMFRIVREALTNVRKHAGARRVTIRVRHPGGALVVEVEDDGRGFDPERLPVTDADWPRLGLSGMRERAAARGGTIDWHPAARQGTVVAISLPVPSAADTSASASPPASASASPPASATPVGPR